MYHLSPPDSDADSAVHSLRRRLHEAPVDIAIRLVEHCGPRPATGLGEARAAAAIDGRLRRAGLHVAADIFTIASRMLWAQVATVVIASLGIALYYWQPAVAILLFVIAFGLSISLWQALWPARLMTSTKSQNVVAVRPADKTQRQRIILLAALDSFLPSARLGQKLATLLHQAWLPALATALLILLASLGMLMPLRVWLFLMLLPLMLMLSSFGASVFDRYAVLSPGAVYHAGSLAVLLASSDSLDGLQSSELWAVALGASSMQAHGLQDLLKRYPFDQATTLFIVLEGIGTGKLCYAVNTAQHDHFNQRIAEALQSTQDLSLCQTQQGLASALKQQGFACISLYAQDERGRRPLYASPHDTPERLDAEQLALATNFVVELVRRLDQV